MVELWKTVFRRRNQRQSRIYNNNVVRAVDAAVIIGQASHPCSPFGEIPDVTLCIQWETDPSGKRIRNQYLDLDPKR